MAGTTVAEAAPTRRRRGSIRPHYGGYQARVSAGVDPATGERIILHETTATRREAEKALTRLLADADALKTARTKANWVCCVRPRLVREGHVWPRRLSGCVDLEPSVRASTGRRSRGSGFHRR
jgi:hypothetical protein